MVTLDLSHNIDAEEAVIGSLLIDGEAIYQIVSLLQPPDFYREKNRWAYEACLSLHSRGEAIDEITVAHELAQHNKLDASGGAAYFSLLVSRVPTSVHLEHYAGIVARCAMLRRLALAGQAITALTEIDKGEDIESLLREARQMLLKVERRMDKAGKPQDLADAIMSLSKPQSEKILHLPWPSVENLTGPLRPGQLWVVGAATALGKTTALLQIGLSLAHAGKVMLYCSGEELIEDISLRISAMLEAVNTWNLLKGTLQPDDEQGLVDASGWVSKSHLWTPHVSTIQDIERWFEICMAEEETLDLVLVDYLQCLVRVKDNRYEATTSVINRLKDLAGEWQVPIMVASQLSRDPERRLSKRPALQDLRDSGAIEQDAHIVLLLYRPSGKELGATQSGETEFIVAKNRLLGRKGVVKLGWDEAHRFYREG